MTDYEIALQITLKVLDKLQFTSFEQAKTFPAELYNSILKDITNK